MPEYDVRHRISTMKKRLEFIPSSYCSFSPESPLAVRFVGEATLELKKCDSVVIAMLSNCDGELTLRGSKLLGRLDWLFLDFQKDDYLHRIGVVVDNLDHEQIARDMKKLTEGTLSGFGHLQVKN